MPRLLLVLRIPKLVALIQLELEEREFLFSSGFQRVIKLYGAFAIAAHYFGCIFFWTAAQKASAGDPENWATHDGLLLPSSLTLSSSSSLPEHSSDQQPSVAMQYARAMYWSIITMVTVGYFLPTACSLFIMCAFAAANMSGYFAF